ncbi:hypothetical protein OROMI_014314 [Orobanche minor]
MRHEMLCVPISKSEKFIMSTHVPNPVVLYLDDLKVDVTGTIVVMICRIWDVNAVSGRYLSTDFVVSDSKGNAIHCTAKGTIAHNFIRLKEGGIYSIKNFVVLPNKDEYRIRKDDTFMLEFDGDTTMRKSLVKPDGFLRHPLQLVHFQKIEPTANKYLIDVAGYVTNVGRTNQTRTGTKNLDFHLANHRGHSIRVTLWGGLGDALIEKKTKHVGLCPVVLTSVSAKNYNNKLYLSSSSSTLILDDPDIPALKELASEMSDVEMMQPALRCNHSEPKDGTIENLLIWSRNRKNDSLIFNCKAKIDTVRTRKGWSYPSCGGEKCKKGATRKEGSYWCDACDVPVPYPVMRYRLELGISDETADTVIVLFDEPATELVKCSAASILDEEDEMSDNGSVPSPPMKDSDHLFGPSEIGPKFAYEAGIRRKIISNNDMFPEWAGYIRRLRACELEEGGSLCNHILEMMNYMNRLEYLDTNFDRNLAVPLLLRSLPDSYNDFLWKNHCENKSKTWIEIINELRRYEENKITQIGKLEEEKGKEKRKEKHYALDAQEGSSKRRKSCSWRDLGNGERKCPKNIEESIGSSS